MITAPASSHGKTTVATGLMGALRGEGLEVAGFKVGPDYIDPGYHAMATGRPGRNLDPHLCRPDQLAPLLLHGSAVPTPADVAVVEGVMGLFDGRMGGDGFASTAHVAGLITAPLVVVVDISRMARTTAALVHGLHTFEPDVRLSGVILNKAGSARLVDEITAALEATGLPVLGVLPRDAGIEAPSRHLGLVPAAEREQAAATVQRLAEQVRDHLDLQALLAVAHTAPDLTSSPGTRPPRSTPPSPARPRVAVAARPGVHVPLRRDRGAAARRGLRPGGDRPARRHRAARGHLRALPRRRLPRGPRHRAERQRLPADRPSPTPSRPACRPSPSAPACSTSAAASTASRWSAPSTPRRS